MIEFSLKKKVQYVATFVRTGPRQKAENSIYTQYVFLGFVHFCG